MSENLPNDLSKRNRRLSVLILITLVLTCVLGAFAWNASVESQTQANRWKDAEAALREQERELEIAQSNSHQALREALNQRMEVTRALLSSFDREELHTALQNAFESAKPSYAVSVAISQGSRKCGRFLWVPEAGHQLLVRLQVEDILPTDYLSEIVELNREWVFDLEPNKLHRIEFEVEERWKQKDCFLRLAWEGEEHLKAHLKLDPSGSSTSGSNGLIIREPRIVASELLWTPESTERIRRGVWLGLANASFRFRRDLPQDEDDATDSSRPPRASVGVNLELASTGDLYVESAQRFRLKQSKIGSKEENERERYLGLLRLQLSEDEE